MHDLGLDFGLGICVHHSHTGDCDDQCRNGRNLIRSGLSIRRPGGWFRCVDYWRAGYSAPDRDGWVDGANS